MATISASAYNDAAARTAGEAITITSGAVWTCRTDYRVHANAPASNLGALGAVTVTEGEWLWDSRNVRWMPYSGGGANVPAIGTIISQGGVQGYLLGIWASKTTAQTAVGAASPATGFMKFREVTGGSFAAGALTGMSGVSATGPDVQGWISLPHGASATFTVPRLGKHSARGGRFFLEDTTGVRGQVFQVPTDGSAAMFAPGLFIETGTGTDEYEFWPALAAAAGWTHVHVGNATGTTDRRQSYLKCAAGGGMTMGETWSASATYASLAAQASTYATIAHSCTYVWANDVVIVYIATGHFLETGQQTGLDFTSGGATANDGIYTVTVLDAYRFSVPLAGSGASGAVTSRPGVLVTMATHAMNIGESVYLDATSGTLPDGTYDIYRVNATGSYSVKYPHTVALTAGAANALHTLVVTLASHGLAVGQTVYCDFTTGTGVDGVYVIKTAATTFNINFPHSATTSGNVTISRDIGYVCPSGRKTWIPSNILNEVATGARATNTIPNATIANRPDWTTTNAGVLDLEYVYGCSGFLSLSQPYGVRLRDCVFFDSSTISEVATALDIDGLHVGMHGSLDAITAYFANCYAGGTVRNMKAMRGNAPGTGDHAFQVVYCKGIIFENIQAAIVQYARSTGYFQVATCNALTFNNCGSLNTRISLSNSSNCTFNNTDRCERLNGNGSAAEPGILTDAGCHNLKVDGMTFGLGGIVQNQQTNYGVYTNGSNNLKIRNIGTRNSPIPLPTWAPNLSAMVYIYQSGGSNNGVKVQRCYVEGVRTAPFVTGNTDKNMTYESVFGGLYVWSSKALLAINHADLNGIINGCMEVNGVSGPASVYGTHIYDVFTGNNYGRIILPCNEPTVETASVFEMNSGTARFNSAGGIMLTAVGNQCTFTDTIFRKGHTGFDIAEALLSGPTQTRFDLHYAIDTGSGFGSFHNLYYQKAGGAGTSGQYTFTVTDATGVEVGDYVWGTGIGQFARVTNIATNTITVNVVNSATVSGTLRFNHLPFESISPSTGFKLKFRLTCIVTEAVACAFLRVDTLSTLSAQADNLYPLDVNPFTFSVEDASGSPVTGYEFRVYLKDPAAGIIGTDLDGAELYNSASYTFNHEYSSNTDIVVQIMKDGYEESTTEYTINSSSQSVKIIMQTEYNI